MKRNIPLKEKEKRVSNIDLFAVAVFIVFAAVMLIGTSYCGVSNDESFYFTISKRILDGDRLLIEEWEPSQLSSVFQFLPYYF